MRTCTQRAPGSLVSGSTRRRYTQCVACHEGAGLLELPRRRRYAKGVVEVGTEGGPAMMYVGIDLHRNRSQIAGLDRDGAEILSRRSSTSPRPFSACSANWAMR